MPRACLDEDTAAAFAGGRLASDELDELERHIDACSDCGRFVAELARQLASPDPGATEPSAAELRSPELEQIHGEPPGRAPAPGERLGHFVLRGVLGSGAMGVVYEADDTMLERRVAIKVLRPDFGVADRAGGAAERMLAEARAMARLSHPNVITVYEAGVAGRHIFIAMELVDGTTLSQWMAALPRPLREVLSVFEQAGRGLEAAHTAGLVHRDFKPDNVLVARDGRVLVTDFGLAGGAGPGIGTALVGTPAYMAPEQSEGAAEARSDQFSFCVALYEAVDGKRPFSGDDLDQLLANVRAGRIRAPLAPAWLDRVIRRGLAADPGERHPSMRALVAELARGQRRRRRWAALAAAALLAGSAAAALALGSRSEEAGCAAEAGQVETVWGEERRREVETALEATGVAFADAAWRSVSARLDERARGWSIARTRVCEARRRGDWAVDLVGLAEDCLAEQLAALDAIAVELAGADAAMAQIAVQAAAVEPFEDCADLAALRVRGVAPADPALRARARALRDRFVRARAASATGRYRQALEAVEPVAAEARDAGVADVEADALILACRLHDQLGDGAASERACHAGAIAAARGGRPELAAKAWALLIGVVATNSARYDDAELWAGYARAALEQAGGDAMTEAMLELHLGVVRKHQGSFTVARAHYLRALELLESVHGERSLVVARALNNLAILEGELGETAAAIERHRRSLAIREEQLGPNHPDVALSLVNLGLLHSRSAAFDDARAALSRALAVAEVALPAHHPTHGVIAVNLGLVEFRTGRTREARDLYLRALHNFEEAHGGEHPRVASVLNNLGLAQRALGDAAGALESHRSALAIYRASIGESHPDVANTIGNVGLALGDLGDVHAALTELKRALAIREQALGNRHRDLAGDLVGIGSMQLRLDAPSRAIAPLERALSLLDGESQPALAGEVRFELARALWAARPDQRDRALELARAALDEYRRVEAEENIQRVKAWLETR